MRPCSSLLVALVLACGTEKTAVTPAPDAPKSAVDAPQPAPDVAEPPPAAARHEGSGTVLDKRGVGPQLCLGGVLESLPPQCSGVPLVGWDWTRVDGEQIAGDTTWGEYRVVGTYDGQRLTPTEPPGPPQHRQDEFKFDTPCSEPPAGWVRPDKKKTGQAALDRVNAAAQNMPGYAGLWLYNLTPPKGEQQDLVDVVLNVAFAGDITQREADLRKLWGGALCVVKREHSEAQLADLRTQAETMLRELGIQMLSSATDVVRGTITVDVTTVTAEQQAKLADKFGEILVVSPRLRPLP